MKKLLQGDKVAFVSPSGKIAKGDLDNALSWFAQQGIEVSVGTHVFDAEGYTAGTKKDRAEDLNKVFADPTVKAIFCTRGGAGSTQILDCLDYDMIKKNKKPLFGLSDSTALQNALYTKAGVASYTGFLPIYDFHTPKLNNRLEASLRHIFAGGLVQETDFEVLQGTDAKGTLVGGCLSVFTLLCGTQFFPDLSGKILLLEDIGEKTYRIDLMLEQLKHQKGFDEIKGIIFGRFEKCTIADEEDGSIEDIIKKFAKSVPNIPVIYHFPYGHIKERVILPIGRQVWIKTNRRTFEEISENNAYSVD